MNTKKQELNAQIEEMETTLSNLKIQLAKIEQQEQHTAIEDLDNYLQAMDNKWDNLRSFWPLVLDELRGLLNKNDDKKE